MQPDGAGFQKNFKIAYTDISYPETTAERSKIRQTLSQFFHGCVKSLNVLVSWADIEMQTNFLRAGMG